MSNSLKRLSFTLSSVLLVGAWSTATLSGGSARAELALPDITVADFEGESYGAWTVEGTAFGNGPARGTLPGQMVVVGFQGKGLVNSFNGGDDSMGRLLSPPFRIERRYLNLLVGGGTQPGRACVNLLMDGKVVRTVTGPNDRPGGSEELTWRTWDLQDLTGKTVRLEILDRATGGWGHINVDHIVQSDLRKEPILLEGIRTIRLEKRYLNLPVKNGAPKRRMSLLLDRLPHREFEIELADADPDFWVFLDVGELRGREAVLRVDRMPFGSQGLSLVTQGDEIAGFETLYREKHRPQFHFTSRRGWLNDPNGLVYHEGKYHLYYQHNPYGWSWGNMHWGHAISTDLLHWEELPVAIYPQRFGDWAFSGSATVDRNNTSGFKAGSAASIVAAYTSTGRGECIAYSNDGGRTFQEYSGNPVLRHDGRDPKIFWYAPGKHWSMAVYSVRDKKDGILFLSSPDLKQWEPHDWTEGYFECPELFELPVEGKPNQSRWVLYGADGSYSLGKFDGKTFTPETAKLPANWGNCFYASQTYNDLPGADGRRIRIGWGQVAIPGMPFNQMMNFPVELTLRSTPDGLRMFANPVREIEKLHEEGQPVPAGPLRPGANPLAAFRGDLWDLEAEVEPGSASEIGFKIRGVPVVYNVQSKTLACAGKTAPLTLAEGAVRLRILVDRTSLEIFGNGGRIYMPIGVIPDDGNHSLEAYSKGGEARIRTLEVHPVRSIWRR